MPILSARCSVWRMRYTWPDSSPLNPRSPTAQCRQPQSRPRICDSLGDTSRPQVKRSDRHGVAVFVYGSSGPKPAARMFAAASLGSSLPTIAPQTTTERAHQSHSDPALVRDQSLRFAVRQTRPERASPERTCSGSQLRLSMRHPTFMHQEDHLIIPQACDTIGRESAETLAAQGFWMPVCDTQQGP
jgi:hypothetical protein